MTKGQTVVHSREHDLTERLVELGLTLEQRHSVLTEFGRYLNRLSTDAYPTSWPDAPQDEHSILARARMQSALLTGVSSDIERFINRAYRPTTLTDMPDWAAAEPKTMPLVPISVAQAVRA